MANVPSMCSCYMSKYTAKTQVVIVLNPTEVLKTSQCLAPNRTSSFHFNLFNVSIQPKCLPLKVLVGNHLYKFHRCLMCQIPI